MPIRVVLVGQLQANSPTRHLAMHLATWPPRQRLATLATSPHRHLESPGTRQADHQVMLCRAGYAPVHDQSRRLLCPNRLTPWLLPLPPDHSLALARACKVDLPKICWQDKIGFFTLLVHFFLLSRAPLRQRARAPHRKQASQRPLAEGVAALATMASTYI